MCRKPTQNARNRPVDGNATGSLQGAMHAGNLKYPLHDEVRLDVRRVTGFWNSRCSFSPLAIGNDHLWRINALKLACASIICSTAITS